MEPTCKLLPMSEGAMRRTFWTAMACLGLAFVGSVTLAATGPELDSPQWWSAFIGNIGFPIAVAAFLLIRMERAQGETNDLLRDLKESIDDAIRRIH